MRAREGASVHASMWSVATLRHVGIALLSALAVTFLPVRAPLVAGVGLFAFILSQVRPDILLILILSLAGVNLQPAFGDALVTSRAESIEPNTVRFIVVLVAFSIMALRISRMLDGLRHIWPFLIFLAFAAVTLAWAPDKAEGLRFLLQLLIPVVVFCLTTAVVRQHGLEPILVGIATAGIIGIAVNFVASLWNRWWLDETQFFRYYGTLGPNPLGSFSAILCLAAFALSRWRWRALFLSLAFILVVQLAMTGSRTSLFAFGIGMLLLQLLRGRWKTALPVVGFCAALWLLVPAIGMRPGVEIDVGGNQSFAGLASEGNLSGRLFIWYDVWTSLIAGSELLGRGLGASTAFMAARYATLRSTHSELVRLLAETGVVGLALFGASLAYLARQVMRVVHSRDELRRDIGRLALSALAIFAFACLTENALNGYLYFVTPIMVLAALAVASPAMSRQLDPAHAS